MEFVRYIFNSMQPDTRGARNERERHVDTQRERAHKARADLFFLFIVVVIV